MQASTVWEGNRMGLYEDIESVAKEGIDLTGIKGQLEGLSNPMTGLETKEAAWELIKSNKLMLSAFDSEQNKRGETTLENFKNGKMKAEWAEKEKALRLELNPEESKADKVSREFAEYKEGIAKKEGISQLKTDLEAKAKEIEFDPIKARDYSVYGDKAIEKLESDAAWFKTELESRLSSELKDKYKGNQQPRDKKIPPADLDTKIREAREKGDSALALRLQLMKQTKSQS
jgi:hypothetical protein